MGPMTFENILLARTFDLPSSVVESKMDSSVLVCLCQAIISQRGVSKELLEHLDWAMATGAQMRFLESNSALFFQVATCPGALDVWSRLIDGGYSLDKVVAKLHPSASSQASVPNSASIANQGSLAKLGNQAGRVSRLTTKLGLLCCAPYCFGPDLPELISLLISQGIDPNERDSDGYAPLGRLNEQLRLHDANSISIDVYLPFLVQAVEVLLQSGADIEGILPIPETFAAKCIQECIKAKREHHELHQQILIPDSTTQLDVSPKSL